MSPSMFLTVLLALHCITVASHEAGSAGEGHKYRIDFNKEIAPN